jgi:5-methylcytosine-specific restriction endonuclease McrA
MPSEKLPEQLSAEIMVRDQATCVYCGASKRQGAQVSVDHIRARSWLGTNATSNLVVACKPCNDAKGNMDAQAYADMIDRYKASIPALQERFGAATGAEILARVEAARKRPIDPAAALEALAAIKAARRGR